jgi:hypothetical protein
VSKLEDAIESIDGVVRGESAFMPGPAWWVNAKEIVHIDSPGVLGIRAGRSEIRRRSKEDDRVEVRRSSSDWCNVAMKHVDVVLELVEVAAAQHRAPTGTTAKPPPIGSDLERRRRFH